MSLDLTNMSTPENNKGENWRKGYQAGVAETQADSLESLIEQCGEDFRKLSKPLRYNYWTATASPKIKGNKWHKTKGSTPREAVTKLLEELKKHESNKK